MESVKQMDTQRRAYRRERNREGKNKGVFGDVCVRVREDREALLIWGYYSSSKEDSQFLLHFFHTCLCVWCVCVNFLCVFVFGWGIFRLGSATQ